MTNVKELYEKYMAKMPSDLKGKREVNAYSNEFWKKQDEITKDKKMFLKRQSIIEKGWVAEAKANARAEARAIAQAKAEVKAEAKAIAKAKADAIEYAKLKKMWDEIFTAHDNAVAEAKAAKAAKAEAAKAEAQKIAKEKEDNFKAIEEVWTKWEIKLKEEERIRNDKAAMRAKPVVMEIIEENLTKSSDPVCCIPGKQKRNLHGYNLFYREQYYKVKELKPELKNSEIMVEIARLWHLKNDLAINLEEPRPRGNNVSNATSGYASCSTSGYASCVSRTPIGSDDMGGQAFWWQPKGP